MTIEWQNIRPFNSSQNNAFEELVCQLAREEEIVNKKEFYRIGAPDGGVEAYCVLDNDDEYGWQAKFFSSMGTSQWSQLKESFETAFRTHPNLTKYYICIPLDRHDPRREKQSWFMDKWNEKTKEWAEYANNNGRDITLNTGEALSLFIVYPKKNTRVESCFGFLRKNFLMNGFSHMLKTV